MSMLSSEHKSEIQSSNATLAHVQRIEILLWKIIVVAIKNIAAPK